MIINHNLNAMNAHRNMMSNVSNSGKSMEKLSSGLRINRAGDDAAGLAISEKMRGQIRGLDQASRNAQDGISLIQTAEGALNETHSILQRMRELSVQSSNDTNVDADRSKIQAEMDQLATEVQRISNQTEFNTKTLLTGEAKDVKFQVGANNGQNVSLAIGDMGAESLKIGTAKAAGAGVKPPVPGGAGKPAPAARAVEIEAVNVKTQADAGKAIETINTAIETVSDQRANLGAMQNRLEHTINNLNTSSENLQAAESRIRDVDMAKEMMSFSKNNILQQAAQAMLAQANQQPQSVLQLLR